ncbi:MAG: carbon-nitrogen family hydrolase [Acidaminococcaceae bacterium]|nr:carbon-nitrogen family hydrolase [Acidaminococcaceae bacterium]
MKIALIQMQVLEKAKEANARHGLELIQQAAGDNDLVILPEIWTTGYSLGHLRTEAEEMDNGFIQSLRDIAKENRCLLLPGSVPMKRDDKIFNTSIAIDRAGKIVNVYDKVHLFQMYHEDRFFAAGDKFNCYELDGITMASTICYDLRFPELYRHMALAGAKICFVVAEWPDTRGAIWRLLLQARAAENHMFVVGVNAVGTNGKQKFFGHSMVCGPDGRIIAEGGTEEEIIRTEIDLDEVEQVRSNLNALKDVRKELIK